MGNLTVTDIVAGTGLIVAIYNFYIFAKNLYTKPSKELEERFNSKLDDMQSEQRLILKAVYQLSLHQLTGNHITDMEALNREIQEHLYM